jgi:hypothetical protein
VVGPRGDDDVHDTREHQLPVDHVQAPEHGRHELPTHCVCYCLETTTIQSNPDAAPLSTPPNSHCANESLEI